MCIPSDKVRANNQLQPPALARNRLYYACMQCIPCANEMRVPGNWDDFDFSKSKVPSYCNVLFIAQSLFGKIKRRDYKCINIFSFSVHDMAPK